jgi:hypothetical protein
MVLTWQAMKLGELPIFLFSVDVYPCKRAFITVPGETVTCRFSVYRQVCIKLCQLMPQLISLTDMCCKLTPQISPKVTYTNITHQYD